jgi:hypothetical protein
MIRSNLGRDLRPAAAAPIIPRKLRAELVPGRSEWWQATVLGKQVGVDLLVIFLGIFDQFETAKFSRIMGSSMTAKSTLSGICCSQALIQRWC